MWIREALMNVDQPLLTSEDVAGFLNVDVVTIRRLISRGELKAYRVGSEYRFDRKDVREYLDRQRVPGRANVEQPSSTGVPQATHLPFPSILPEGLMFTPDAQLVLHLAVEEARQVDRSHVGTEHLLLGLVRDTTGSAGRVLRDAGVDYTQVLRAVEFLVGHDQDLRTDVHLQMSATTRKVFAAAVDAARARHQTHLGTEHLLFGLMSFQGVAATALEMAGVTFDAIRPAVVAALAEK